MCMLKKKEKFTNNTVLTLFTIKLPNHNKHKYILTLLILSQRMNDQYKFKNQIKK